MKKTLIVLFYALLFSCSEKETESIPTGILSTEKMTEVLVDVHLLEASMNLVSNPGTIASADVQAGMDVFKKHSITKQQYDESFAYYSRNPKLLVEIYQQVLNNFSKMQAEMMGKPDSLNVLQK